MDKTPEIQPYQTMQGHSEQVRGVTHLSDGRHIVTCSSDGSLRLWDRESGAQIGNDWRDDEDKVDVETIALSPNGNTVASGSRNGIVRLWDIETRKVIAKWTGRTNTVWSVRWSADGLHVASGSNNGRVRIWDVDSGELVLGPVFHTGNQQVYAVAYSPDASKIATCGQGGKNAGIEIWDATTGKLLSTPEYHSSVWSLAWTSDQKKLIAGYHHSIKIFNTDTWQQVAIMDDLDGTVYAISLFRNDRLLASASHGKTARVWNLDTNLPVGPPLRHEKFVDDVAWSADGKFLATACQDKNAYVWDIHTILRDAGLEELLSVPNVTGPEDASSLPEGLLAEQNLSSPNVNDLKSILDADATPHPTNTEDTHTLPEGFFDDARDRIDIPSDDTHRLPQLEDTSRPSQTLPDDSQDRIHSSTTRTHPQAPSSIHRHRSLIPFSGPGARTGRRIITGHEPAVVDVPEGRDNQPLYVAPPQPEKASERAKRIKNPTLWMRFIFFILCVRRTQE